MHIKKVEIFGFKSFGFKNTTVQLEPGLVSISGPNGSGKSNILDAIIFAMGENKSKILRVDRLRSLIHDIDKDRRSPKIARSSVHFDNADRKIPIDSDMVEITREMDANGENTYYLNRKKTTRSHILDLLDMANAGLGQLNAVQQGTITRISEMTSDEKRLAIENMLGLSYFDDKKTAALEQLSAADRRLEIALVKMGGMKTQINELEVERNQKLRYDFLQKELIRYRAIGAANDLNRVLNSKLEKEKSLLDLSANISKFDTERNILHIDIKKLESEKSTLMSEADTYSKTKAELDRKISDAIYEHGREESIITESQKSIERIESRLPQIKIELENITSRRTEISSQFQQVEKSLQTLAEKKKQINTKLNLVNSKRVQILNEQSKATVNRTRINQKINTLTKQLHDVQLKLNELYNKKTTSSNKLQSNSYNLNNLKQNVVDLLNTKTRLDDIIKNHTDIISELNSRLTKLYLKKSKLTSELGDLERILETTSKAANQYESKIKTAKRFMHEDYTVAKLKEDAKELGILGLAYELVTWDKKYDRPILAASSDWLKSLVVKDFTTMLEIADFARSKKLPKLKFIPLEAISNSHLELPNDSGAIGVLSDYVKCDDKCLKLRTFLFGNIILADSKESAYRISKSGYKSVSIDGEFFESRGSTVVIDINSKLSKLTKLFSMSSDIDGLFSSIQLVKKYIQKQKQTISKIESSITSNSDNLFTSEKKLAADVVTRSNLERSISSILQKQNQLTERIDYLSLFLSSLDVKISICISHVNSLNERIQIMNENYIGNQDTKIDQDLSKINAKKLEIEQLLDQITSQHNDVSSNFASLQVKDSGELSNKKRLLVEESSLLTQKEEFTDKIKTHMEIKNNKQNILVQLRQSEQDLIISSGSSIKDIQEYDDQLKILFSKEKQLTKDTNLLKRNSDQLERDITDLKSDEENLKKIIQTSGLEIEYERFDVTQMVQSLSVELDSLNLLNAMAPEKYMSISEGYSSLSPRKNELEEERNSIVKFIEQVEREKRQTFLNAFDMVDKEIRLTFGKMTGGNAWLELQNEDDIFNSGMSYMIQFPEKSKRESTSLSGGEKTLAAIVFVLALQKLRPSPFYLFDEIDAHLDAPNSERLAKILDERANESQFIMVSLKDSVVQKAKLIYGVYPKNDVSHVVVYKNNKMPKVTEQNKKST